MAPAISHDELATQTARLYGWTRRRPAITARLDTLISRLLAEGTLTGEQNNLTTSGSMTLLLNGRYVPPALLEPVRSIMCR